MSDAAEGSHHQGADLSAGPAQAPEIRKPWKTPKVITGAMSGANAATLNGTGITDGIHSYTS